jgi:hypothetical protein
MQLVSTLGGVVSSAGAGLVRIIGSALHVSTMSDRGCGGVVQRGNDPALAAATVEALNAELGGARLAKVMTALARPTRLVLGDVGSSLGDAKSSLGDAKSSLGDAKSSLGDAKSSLGDAESSLGDAKSSLGDAKSSLGDAKSSLGDAYISRWATSQVMTALARPTRLVRGKEVPGSAADLNVELMGAEEKVHPTNSLHKS